MGVVQPVIQLTLYLEGLCLIVSNALATGM